MFTKIWVLWLLLLPGVCLQAQETLSTTEQEDLRFMYAEEQLARDVYDSMYVRWAVNPFGNIRQSERRHMERMYALLERYGIRVAVPVAGRFTDTALQRLYDECVRSGSAGLTAALRAGALVEEADIRDLQERMRRTGRTDLLEAYQYLLEGSERHLAAFSRRLRGEGIIYEPVILGAEAYQRIVAQKGH
jgi:hypothetical protein